MRKLYVDMDGTLTEWKNASIEEVTSPGWFRQASPADSVVSAIRRLISADNDVEVFILSAVFSDDHSIQEKTEWLSFFLPEIDEQHILFVPYGEKKTDYVQEKNTFLLDDFSKNLYEWNGTGIKVYNGVNGTKGTWHGYSVHSSMSSEIMYTQLLGIINAVVQSEKESV